MNSIPYPDTKFQTQTLNSPISTVSAPIATINRSFELWINHIPEQSHSSAHRPDSKQSIHLILFNIVFSSAHTRPDSNQSTKALFGFENAWPELLASVGLQTLHSSQESWTTSVLLYFHLFSKWYYFLYFQRFCVFCQTFQTKSSTL